MNRCILFATTLLAAPLAAGLVNAQAPADSAIRSIIKERVDAGRFAGIVVGVISPDGKRRIVAYGPAAGVTPFDGNTVFEIGSITKAFSASILADMVKEGELSLSDPVENFLRLGTTPRPRSSRTGIFQPLPASARSAG